MTDDEAMIEVVSDALRAECREIFGSTWNYDNSKRLALAAMRAMRFVPDICYDGYRCDKSWQDLNSKEVWNLWLDAALGRGGEEGK